MYVLFFIFIFILIPKNHTAKKQSRDHRYKKPSNENPSNEKKTTVPQRRTRQPGHAVRTDANSKFCDEGDINRKTGTTFTTRAVFKKPVFNDLNEQIDFERYNLTFKTILVSDKHVAIVFFCNHKQRLYARYRTVIEKPSNYILEGSVTPEMVANVEYLFTDEWKTVPTASQEFGKLVYVTQLDPEQPVLYFDAKTKTIFGDDSINNHGDGFAEAPPDTFLDNVPEPAFGAMYEMLSENPTPKKRRRSARHHKNHRHISKKQRTEVSEAEEDDDVEDEDDDTTMKKSLIKINMTNSETLRQNSETFQKNSVIIAQFLQMTSDLRKELKDLTQKRK